MRPISVIFSIKLRIIGLCVSTGLAAALGAGLAVERATRAELQRQLLAGDRNDRERIAALLGGKLETLKATLSAVAAKVPPELLHDAAGMSDFLLGRFAVGVLYDSVFAAAHDGRMLARIGRDRPTAELPNIGDREYFKRAMQTDQPVVSDPLLGRLGNAPLLIVASPVLGPEGRTIGIVGGSLRLQSNGLFSSPSPTHEGDDVRELVMDRSGRLLAHSNPARILGHAVDEPGLAAVFRRWHGSGSPIDTVGTAELSEDHLVSMAGIPLSDWALVRLTPHASALAPLAAAKRTAATAALMAGLLAALLAGLLAWAIARPISRLRDRAERLLAGNESAEGGWTHEAGEIGAMSHAFEQLLRAREDQRTRLQGVLVQMAAVLDNAEVGIALTRDGRFELVSRQFCLTFSYQREQVVGQSTRLIYPSDDAYDAMSARARPAFMEHGMFDGEVELQRANGQAFWARMRGRAVLPGDRSKGTIWVFTDITAERDQRNRLSYAASHDRLTGLVNRAAFEARLDEATAHAVEEPFCALFIDLDRFKAVNDTGGHAAGDALLHGLARELGSQVRKSDTLARLGGDEFAVLLLRCPAPQAHALAEKLRAAVEAYRLDWEGRQFTVGASIGLVIADGRHATAAEVLRAADTACYEAKRSGRNRVEAAVAA